MVRQIKRYGSRKLYDTEESRYVSLEQLGRWVVDGQEIQVIDNKTGEDVTAQTLTQVILEGGKKSHSFPNSEVLHQLIRSGGEFVSSVNQGVDKLLQKGIDRLPPIRQVREETSLLRRRLEELESSLERLEKHEPAKTEIEAEAPAAEAVNE